MSQSSSADPRCTSAETRSVVQTRLVSRGRELSATVGAEPRDREVREIRLEIVVLADQGLDLVRFAQRQVVLRTAARAGQVDVAGLLRTVVLRAALEMRVGEDPCLL